MQTSIPIQKRIDDWLKGSFDENTKEAIKNLQSSDPKKLSDLFYTDLSFGTGGLRGLMDVGPNRMNIYTVRRASLGLANYIRKSVGDKKGSVVIGFDSRHNSSLFAQEAAKTLAAQNIKVFLLNNLRPTPFVSFACRHLKCTAAIMITASHNPAEYNGYKVYWSDGGQIVAPHDQGIMDEVLAITSLDSIPLSDLSSEFIQHVDDALDLEYIKAIRAVEQRETQNHEHGKDLKIVYSSIHGAGITLAPKCLNDWGFTSVSLVEPQCHPDGSFPTVKSPNPEYPETLKMGINQLITSQSDLLLVTDPDADRLAVVVRHNDEPIILNGNETASICTAYLVDVLKRKDALSPSWNVVTTIVSTELLPTLCKSYNIGCTEVLTGFKYIGEKIHQWEQEGFKNKFLFGAEESYGYLAGTHSRDKDAIVSCCLIAEIALHAKLQGKTLIDFLHDIFKTHGVFKEGQYSLDFPPGKEGMDTMKAIMQKLRSNPIESFIGTKTLKVEDFLTKEKKDLSNGSQEPISLPKSDVLLYRLADGSKVIFRPSGTEPKLKIYTCVRVKEFKDIKQGIEKAQAKVKELIENAKTYLND